MADLDLDAIERRAVLGNRGPTGIEAAALVAEVRRLRAEVAEARKATGDAIAELRMERMHHARTQRALWDCLEEADRG